MAAFLVTTLNDSGDDATVTGNFAVDNADGGGLSLREAILLANESPDEDTITFAAALAGMTLTLQSGELWLTEDVIINGDVDLDGSGITISGGDASRIFSVFGATTDVVLRGLSLIDGMSAGDGGAIHAEADTALTIVDTTLRDNESAQAGGAIYSAGTVILVGSTVNANIAATGGGLAQSGGSVTLTNATVHGNSATGQGGGLHVTGTSADILNSTVTGNTAYSASANASGGGLHTDGASTVTVSNSVIAQNVSGTSMTANDVSGTVDIGTYSFFGTTETITSATMMQNGGGDPLLSALGDHGGVVQTRLVLAGSPLADAGDASVRPADSLDLDGDLDTSEPLPLDGRRQERVTGLGLDIGASEQASLVIVDSLADVDDGDYSEGQVSLREALSLVATAGTIRFDAALSGQTITLAGGVLGLTRDVTIDGDTDGDERADVTISGGDLDAIFSVTGSDTDVDLFSLTLTDGAAGSAGGAIFQAAGTTLDIVHSTISGNSSTSAGGGIASEGALRLVNSTVEGNTASGRGGGIAQTNGTLTLINTTVDGNSSLGFGGGISLAATADASLHTSTIAGNRADTNGGDGGAGGGLRVAGTASVTITNTVIAANTSGTAETANDVSGTVDTARHSFFGTAVSITSELAGVTTDGGDPMLAALADTGGPVQTRAPLAGSALIDAGLGSALPSDGFDLDDDASTADPLPVDARGVSRIVGAAPDIGAHERSDTLTVDLLSDEFDGDFSAGDLSLREALAIVATGGSISFDAALAGGTVMLGGNLAVSRDVTVNGDTDGDGAADVTISGNDIHTIFSVTGAGTDVALHSLTLTGGYGYGGGAIALYAGAGLGIFNSTIRDSRSDFGGGAIESAGTLSIIGTTIHNNMADEDGGGLLLTGGSLTLVNSTLTGNTTGEDGGAIAIAGTTDVRIESSTIADNTATGTGDEIYRTGGGSGLTITNSVVSGEVQGTVDTATGSFFGSATGITTSVGSINAGGDPMLDALGNNGGPVQTRAALAGSALIDAGSNADLPDDTHDLDGDADTAEPLPVDARGVVRISGGTTDIGAVERIDSIVVDTLIDESDGNLEPGDVSLREALAVVGRDGLVSFAPGLSGTITLGGTDLAIRQGVTIDGDTDGDGRADIAISGNAQSRIFDISNVYGGFTDTVNLCNLSLTNGIAGGLSPYTSEANSAGGAIYLEAGTLNILNTTISGNRGTEGGGISSGGIVTVTNSTISGNTADAYGGGLFQIGGSVTLVNSTVYGNDSAFFGGGLSLDGADGYFHSSTITGNLADRNGVGGNVGGGFELFGPSSAILTNTVVAGNTSGTGGAQADDVAGTVDSATSSFFGTYVAITSNTGSTVTGGDPMLSGLSDFGGPVQTRVPLLGSALIDGGDAGALPADTQDIDSDANTAEPLPLDANGNARSGGAGPDIGAAEQLQTVTVNTLDDIDNGDFGPDDLSLREAVGLVATGGRIVFAAGLAGGTISLTGAQISLSRSVTIDGDTDGNGRADITIGRTSGTLALFDVGGSGTGVELRSVTLTGGEVGAVTLAAGAGLDIVNSTIRDNTTASVGGAVSSAGDLTLTGSTLSGNTATGNGGAIYQSAGTLTLVNTTIDGNGSQAVGGGIATSGAATVSILNSTITGNGADSDGANVSDGGGLFLSGLSDTTISNSVIALNTSGSGANGDDVYGTVDAATNSFFGTAATFTTGSGNINGGGDPLLAALADNGGPVQTRLALAASPLVDAGNAALLPADAQDLDGDADTAEALPLDANGALRVDNGLLDIGATERRPLVTVDTAADEDDGDYSAGDLSLREALKLVSDGGTVGFDAALAGQTLVLGGAHLTVDRRVTIDGDANGDGTGDIAISGNDLSRILDVTGDGTSLDLRNLVLTDGNAQGTDAEDDGGAIRAAFGTTVSLLDTHVRDSVAVDGGGGISSSGALTLVNSTVSGNMSGTGGGITATVGGLSLVNSTVAGNSSAGFAGGIFIGAATATIENSTIASNKAAIGSALGNAGGGISSIGSSIYVINSVLAGNTSGAPGSETADDVDGGINSATNSFFGTAEAITTSTATTNGGGDPGLSALGYFGGDVPTLVPLAGSALIGAGNASLRPVDASDLDGDANTAEPLPLDATRGARVVGGTLDIGAAEERSATVVVDTLEGADDGDYGSGDISLREALVLVAPGGTISFDAALAGGTVDLGGSALALRRDVSISGDTDADGAADITVTGGNASRVFHQIGGSATLSALAITGGNALTGGQNGEGGGIYSTAGTSLVLSGVSISGSRATTGGGIANAGNLTLIGSTISGNQATSGGGLHHSGQALIVNSTVAGNSTTTTGGGIFSAADLTLTSSTVSGNSAVAQGGGLYVAAGTAAVANSLILGNATTAAGMGGPEIAVTGGAALAFGGSNLVGENSAAFDASGHANAQNAAAATVFAATAETLSDVDLDGTPEAATGVLGGVLADNGGAVETVALRASAGNGALEAGDATLLDEAVAGQDLNGDGDMTDVIAADGRGFARLFDIAGVGSGTLDLGAFELGPTPADDTLFIGPGGGSIDALAGDDIVTGSSATDTLIGGPGGDALDGAGGNDTASYATATALVEYDRVVPTRRAGDAVGDVLTSIERIVGSAFNDDLRGAGLAETLEGGDGADRLVGRGGVDLMIGGAGNDILLGGGGGDVLVGGPGADFLRGDAGIDRANFADAAAGLTADLAAFGNNTGAAAGDQFFTIENVDGTNFDDDLRGDSAGNHLRGRDGDDTLRGRGGDDTLEGGRGSDSLIGGNGIDRFLFTGPNQGTDTLTDFVSGEDLLVFTGASFGGLAAGALPAGNFALDAAADANDRFIYDTATGQLFFDADGTGPGAAKLLAVLAGQPLIGAGDILIT